MNTEGAAPQEERAEEDVHASCAATIAELTGKWKRALADLANAERQHARAREEQAAYAAASVLRDLLPTVDAVDAAAHALASDVGLQQVRKQLHDVLAHHGVTPVAREGMPDYLCHEVVGERADEGAPPGTIVEVVQQGYALHGKCLRPARVIVAAEPAARADHPRDGGEA